MSENLETKSLVLLATRLDPNTRFASTQKLANDVSAPTRAKQFNGFLNSFLSQSMSGSSGSFATPGTAAKAKRSGASSASGLFNDGGDKNVEAKEETDTPAEAEEGSESPERYDEQVAAAAAEAARLIMELMQEGISLAGVENMDSATLASLAARLGANKDALASMNPASLSPTEMAAALYTSNARAQMNQSAVLDSLQQLMVSLPPAALDNFLALTANEMGLTYQGENSDFARMAQALQMKVVESGRGNADAAQLLAQLAIPSLDSNSMAMRQKSAFPQDNSAAVIGTGAAQGNKNDATGGEKSGTAASQTPAATADKNGGAVGGETKSDMKSVLENVLQSTTGSTGSTAHSVTGETGENSVTAASNQSQAPAQSANNAEAAQQAQHTAGTTMLDRIENLERMAEIMRMAHRGGVHNLTMQLSPVELGKITLRVEARNGVVSAKFKVEKSDTAAQLGNSLQQLRESLKAQGIELGELDISHQPDIASGDGSGRGGEHESWSAERRQRNGIRDDAVQGDEPAEALAAGGGDGSLNLFA
ncbi:MAG: flagellar hook-length control protein FliK [Planctomycetes bacterium]|nr:flagellar hook-length control protein FliK [Planctomycetota bacterium]